MENKKPTYSVRIKPAIYEILVELAAKNSRSVTQEINYRLEQSLDK